MHVLQHPLAEHYLCQLRDRDTPAAEFRRLCHRLTELLLVEALREFKLRRQQVQTPLETTEGQSLDQNIVAVPILRAGLGMLDAVTTMLPEARIGYLGMERDEQTAVASTYYRKLPPIGQNQVLLLDPMLATGGSAVSALRILSAGKPAGISMLCVVAAPEGVRHVRDSFPQVSIFTAALDRCLDERKFILPGLGDFGDRLFGT